MDDSCFEESEDEFIEHQDSDNKQIQSHANLNK